MTTILAYFPSPPRGVWHLGPIPIRAYALFIIVGIVVALLIGDRRWEQRGGERGVIYDIALWAVPFGLIGGRLYHLITDWRTYFGGGGAGWGAALRIWDGGLGIWGAVALGGVGAWIACRRRGIPLPAFADAVAPGIVLAQAIGRLGNYFNQELFGRETTLPWGMEVFYRRDPAGFVDVHSLDGVSTGQLAMVVQPTFLYEMLWNILIFAALIYLDRRLTLGHGRLFALYVAGYCVGRFCIELLRDDPATHIAGIRVNLFTSTFVFIGAVVYIMVAPRGREDPATLGGTPALAEETPTPVPATELAAVASATGAGDAATLSGQGGDGLVEPAETEKAAEVEKAAEAEEAAEAEKGLEAEPAAEVEKAAETEAAAEAEEGTPQEVEAEEVPAEAESAEPAEAQAAKVEPAEPEVAWEPEVGEVGEAEAEEAEPEKVEAIALEEAEAEEAEPEVLEAEADEVQPEQAEVEEAEVEKVELEAEPEEATPEEAEAEPEEATAEEAEAEPEEAEAAEVELEETEAEQAEAEVPAAEEPEVPEPKAPEEAAPEEGAEATGLEETEEPEPEAEPSPESKAEPSPEPTAEAEAEPETATYTQQPVIADSRITRWSSRLRRLRRPRRGTDGR